jgi:hypothetical protein
VTIAGSTSSASPTKLPLPGPLHAMFSRLLLKVTVLKPAL